MAPEFTLIDDSGQGQGQAASGAARHSRELTSLGAPQIKLYKRRGAISVNDTVPQAAMQR